MNGNLLATCQHKAGLTDHPQALGTEVDDALEFVEEKSAVDAEARALDLDAEIQNLKLTIAKLQHDAHGKSSERTSILLELELQLGELVERRAEETAADEIAAAQSPSTISGETTTDTPKQRRKSARRPLDPKLPRGRGVEPSPTACPCCGGSSGRSAKMSPRCWSACPRPSR